MTSGPLEHPSLTAVLGPTNTGKTHLAVERMLGHETGMIGLPLRLLAREVYEKVVRAKGVEKAALITGEEKIAPKTARYFVCTVEAMPVARRTSFVGVDEVQLAGDPERGHVFTQRLMHARGVHETMVMGAATMRPLISRLLPEAQHEQRERLSQLTHTGPAKLAKLPRRSAIVAFSADAVYAIAELLKRQRGGAAVVMGALSPRTRNAQVALYQSGEVDFLVATDAIGMGLNMDVDHVAFAALRKFDGRRRRGLRPDEIAQIAGRAGRHTNDGAFGTTGDCRPIPEDVVERVVNHDFQSVDRLVWRNHELDFSSVETLLSTLNAPPPDRALRRIRDAADEVAFRTLADDPEIRPFITHADGVRRLWAACQIPDFRKSTIDHHVRLIGSFARYLLSKSGRIPQSWAGAEIEKLDRSTGEVDALSARLAHIRTWTYAANRTDWFDDPAHWRGVTRNVEDRLSDALHERLTQRFVDRRTSALVRGLNAGNELEAHVAKDGSVLVEGHHVGHLEGLTFHPDNRGGALEGRALRNAALKALRPEIARRLRALEKTPNSAFSLGDDLRVRLHDHVVGVLSPGSSELSPKVRLVGADHAAAPVRDRAITRLEQWICDLIKDDLGPLYSLSEAISSGELPGLARGVAFQLVEGLGHVERRAIAKDIRALSADERKALRALGVKFGEFVIFLPALIKPKPARLCALLFATGARNTQSEDRPVFIAPAGRTSLPICSTIPPLGYAAAGYRPCGPRAVRLDILERLAELVRKARVEQAAATRPENAAAAIENKEPTAAAGAQTHNTSSPAQPAPSHPAEGGDPGPQSPFAVTPDMMNLLGCSSNDLEGVLQALGFRRVRNARTAAGDGVESNEPSLWRAPGGGKRRKRRLTQSAQTPAAPDSPFAAALAEFQIVEQPQSGSSQRHKKRVNTPARTSSNS